MESSSPQDRYMEILMEKVRADRYPSGDLMDRIEVSLRSRSQAEAYLDLLYEKVGDDRYPSGQMLDRIQRNVARIGTEELRAVQRPD
jgi:hypothetical protein